MPMCGLRGKTISWSTKMQGTVARTSSGAETVPQGDALRRIAGVDRGLFTPKKLAFDKMKKKLGKKLGFHALAGETVCIVAADKTASEHMRRISKMQSALLFSTRGAVRNLGILESRDLDEKGSIVPPPWKT